MGKVYKKLDYQVQLWNLQVGVTMRTTKRSGEITPEFGIITRDNQHSRILSNAKGYVANSSVWNRDTRSAASTFACSPAAHIRAVDRNGLIGPCIIQDTISHDEFRVLVNMLLRSPSARATGRSSTSLLAYIWGSVYRIDIWMATVLSRRPFETQSILPLFTIFVSFVCLFLFFCLMFYEFSFLSRL